MPSWPAVNHGDVEDAVTGLRLMSLLPAGVYVTAPGSTSGTTTQAIGVVQYMPIFLPPGTVDEVAARINTAATAGSGGTVQLGIYDTASTPDATLGRVPGTRLAQSSNISTESTGTKVVTSLGVAVAGGLYWLAALPLVATASFSPVAETSNTGRIGVSTIGTVNMHTLAQTASPLPATAAASGAGVSNAMRLWCLMSAVS